LHCIALHCIALHCIALHCIALPRLPEVVDERVPLVVAPHVQLVVLSEREDRSVPAAQRQLLGGAPFYLCRPGRFHRAARNGHPQEASERFEAIRDVSHPHALPCA